MGTNTPTAGGEQKPDVKHEGRSSYHGGGRNNSNRNNNNHNTRGKILGADANLCRKVFEAKRNQSEQVASFKTANNLIKAQVGTEYDPFVLESLEQDSIASPQELAPVYMAKVAVTDLDVMSEVEKMKFKSNFDKCLTQTDKIEMQLKQVFSKY